MDLWTLIVAIVAAAVCLWLIPFFAPLWLAGIVAFLVFVAIFTGRVGTPR